MEIYNYYIKTNSYNYDFIIDNNISINENQTIKFKLINFSMMNSMLNVSAYHGNNKFKITLDNVDYNYTIPDGSYTAITLRDKMNDLTDIHSLPLAFNYEKSTNKYYIIVSADINMGELIYYPQTTSFLTGFTNISYQIPTGTYYANNFANMLPYSKICLVSSSLPFTYGTNNNLMPEYNNTSGINEIICWINRDIPPFTIINYNNYENNIFEISSKNIKTINFMIMNEYKQIIMDAPPAFINFQLIVENKKNNNELSKIYEVLNNIYYSILSLFGSLVKKKII